MSLQGLFTLADAVDIAAEAMQSTEGQSMWLTTLDIDLGEWMTFVEAIVQNTNDEGDPEPTSKQVGTAAYFIQIGYFLAETSR